MSNQDLTVNDVLAEMRLSSRNRVYAWIKQGELPAYNVGGALHPVYRFRREDVEKLKERLMKATTPRDESPAQAM